MMRTPVGYQRVRELLTLRVPLPARPAFIDSGVIRRTETESNLLFRPGVAVEDTPLGHLEFGLRNEGVNLALIAAALEHILPSEITNRLKHSPNSEYARRLAFLWEWLHPEQSLEAPRPQGGYVELFPSEEYIVTAQGQRHRGLRVINNALGNPDFCPVVRRNEHPGDGALENTLDQVRNLINQVDPDDYERATRYLYLAETQGSFEIERDTPDADRAARFVQLLRHAGNSDEVNEDYLVKIQNAVVRNDFSKEAGYRTKQNWLSRTDRLVDFFPPKPEDLRSMMEGWKTFANDKGQNLDPLTHIACTAFGLVYLHPFMDGNGRIHRFLIHKLLARSGLVDSKIVIPVSAVILKRINQYSNVLRHFSEPVMTLWNYRITDPEPYVLKSAHPAVYRYPNCGREVRFLNDMLKIAVSEEIPRELKWLRGFDRAREQIESEFDLSDRDINTLIKVIHQNKNKLAKGRRSRYEYIPDGVIERIETIIAKAFETS